MPKLKLYSRPLALTIITIVAIAIFEFMVMGILSFLPALTLFEQALVDVLILSLTITPLLYFAFFRPLRINIKSLKMANERIVKQQYAINKSQELGHTGTWELDLICKKLIWSDEVYRMFGVPLDSEPSYEAFLGWIHPDDRNFVAKEWNAALAGKPYCIEHRLLVDGETRWVREKAELEFSKDGTAVRAIGFSQDITELKTLQEKTIRTAQLATAGEFSTIIAHEVNNPLSGIIGYAQILLNRSEDGCRNKELLQRIIKEGDRIAKIVCGLLTLSYNSGNKKSNQDLLPIILDALALMSSQIKKKGITLQVNLPETIHPIKCNAQQIEQVVLNIVRNAYQALLEGVLEGSGEKTIKVNAEFIVIDSQNHAQLTIANNGPNIPVDLIPKINEPFFTTKPPGTGTGLGLSISNDIMLDHGGTLEVRSEPCQYTEMILRLPVAPHPSVN
jgi:PAS domain S-box-containing protein